MWIRDNVQFALNSTVRKKTGAAKAGPAPCDAVDVGRVAVPAGRQTGKRLRLTRRDSASISPVSKIAAPTSVSEALEVDLTQLDSEMEQAPIQPGAPPLSIAESESDTEIARTCPGDDWCCSLLRMNRTIEVVMFIRC